MGADMAVKTKEYKYFASKCCVFFRRLTTIKRQGTDLDCSGFTLVELIMVVAILGVLAAMSIPAFNDYIDSTKEKVCAADIRTIDKSISAYVIEYNTLPADLNAAGMGTVLDPWRRPYEYVKVVAGAELQDSLLQPMNTDYDLYSKGKDGDSIAAPGSALINEDDIVRSNNGIYVGKRP